MAAGAEWKPLVLLPAHANSELSDLHECWPRPYQLVHVCLSLSRSHSLPLSFSFLRFWVCLRMQRGSHLFLLTSWPAFVYVRVRPRCISGVRVDGEPLTHEALSGIRSLYQHNASATAIHDHKLLQYRMGGLLGAALDYRHFSRGPFYSLLWCFVPLCPLAPSSRASAHRTRLRISDCIMLPLPLVSGQYAEPGI